jgi:hypothetical protein
MADSENNPSKMQRIIGILSSREKFAHFLMGCFVVLPAVGVSMLGMPGAGLIVAGVNAGMYGYLLGRD